MKSKIALFILVLTFGAAASAAAEDKNVAYQNTLLARTLSPTDKAYCDRKVASGADYSPCQVTRLLISDVSAQPPQDRGYPPMATILYAAKSEWHFITDTMAKYNGS